MLYCVLQMCMLYCVQDILTPTSSSNVSLEMTDETSPHERDVSFVETILEEDDNALDDVFPEDTGGMAELSDQDDDKIDDAEIDW